MARITFEMSEEASSALRLPPSEFVREIRIAAAMFWYSRGEISQSIGAAIAGVSRAEFLDALARQKIRVVQETGDELKDDIHRQ